MTNATRELEGSAKTIATVGELGGREGFPRTEEKGKQERCGEGEGRNGALGGGTSSWEAPGRAKEEPHGRRCSTLKFFLKEDCWVRNWILLESNNPAYSLLLCV